MAAVAMHHFSGPSAPFVRSKGTVSGGVFISTGTISNYETGTHFPDVEKLIALADHFHVTTDYLLGRCRQDCSPDIFDTLIAEGKTIGDLIQEVRTLPPERRQLLLTLLEDMKLASVIREYRREKP